MRGFVALIHKEWRDVRALTWASMAIAVALCLGLRFALAAFLREDQGAFPTQSWYGFFVPLSIVFYAAVIAADLVGAEAASHRIDGSVLLPVGALRVWCAKLTFLAGATVTFAAWCVLVQIGALWVFEGATAAWACVEWTRDNAVAGAAVGGTFLAAALLASTFRLRGLGALIAGGIFGGAMLAGAAAFVRFTGLGLRLAEDEPVPRWLLGVWMPGALVVAATLTFVHGRLHLGRVLRPVGIGAAALVLLLAPGGALLAHDVLQVVPGRPGVQLVDVEPSPDGRYVAMMFSRPRRERSADAALYVLDTATRDLREAGADGRLGDDVWSADGTLTVTGWDGDAFERRTVDPATGTTVRSERIDSDTMRARLTAREQRNSHTARKYEWSYSGAVEGKDGVPWIAEYRSRLTDAKVTVGTFLLPGTSAGVRVDRIFCFPEPNVLATRERPDAEERRLLVADRPWKIAFLGGVSPDAKLLLVSYRGTWRVLDLATSALTDLPPPALSTPRWLPVTGAPERRVVALRSYPTTSVFDVDTRETADWPCVGDQRVIALADGRMVAWSWDGRIDLIGRDLAHVRRLWPLDAERGTR